MALILTAISCQPASLADLPSHAPVRLGQDDPCSRGGDPLAVPPAPPIDDSSIAPPAAYARLMRVTAYCACKHCCGPKAAGITASGLKVTANRGRFVSADHGVHMGTMLVIPGYSGGRPVPVLDRGGAIRGNRLDIFIPSHKAARRWGVKWLEVTFLPRPAAEPRGLELVRAGRD